MFARAVGVRARSWNAGKVCKLIQWTSMHVLRALGSTGQRGDWGQHLRGRSRGTGTAAVIAQSPAILILSNISNSTMSIHIPLFEVPQPISRSSRIAVVVEIEEESKKQRALNIEMARSGRSGGATPPSSFALSWAQHFDSCLYKNSIHYIGILVYNASAILKIERGTNKIEVIHARYARFGRSLFVSLIRLSYSNWGQINRSNTVK